MDILKRPQIFETISKLIWHLLNKRQIMWDIVSNFVAFLKNLNFTKKSQSLTTDSKFSAIYHHVASMWHPNYPISKQLIWDWVPPKIETFKFSASYSNKLEYVDFWPKINALHSFKNLDSFLEIGILLPKLFWPTVRKQLL